MQVYVHISNKANSFRLINGSLMSIINAAVVHVYCTLPSLNFLTKLQRLLTFFNEVSVNEDPGA